MNDKIMSLSSSTRELRIERNAADAQRFELKLLLARLNIVDKQGAGILLDIMGMHEGQRSKIKEEAIVQTLIATEMRPAPKKKDPPSVPLKREVLDPTSSEYAYKTKA